MENNLKRSLHMILNGAMKEKEEFINKVCEMIEHKECDCTIDLESGKNVNKSTCGCVMSGECSCGDDCKCNNCSCHNHKHMSQAFIKVLEKLSHSINELNNTIKHSKKQQ